MKIETANTILYCDNWEETAAFYRDKLALPILTANDWFIEFQLTPASCLSIADVRRTTQHSARGAGITLTFKVNNLEQIWKNLAEKNVEPDPIRTCKMGGQAFFFYDPEGNRLECWTT
ncbi:VOC family protein [Pontiellaceae bacterium B12219]|nr:VOC family protein [Pontiellaceae bacterium B12219]